MALSDATKAKLRTELETQLRETADVENVDALISAAFGQLEWDDFACTIIEDVIDERNTDRIIDLLLPKVEAVVDAVLGRLGFFVRLLPWVDPVDRIRAALDRALPGLIRDPIMAVLCEDEAES